MTDRAYELLERVASLLRAEQRRESGATGLEPVHLQALTYLALANRYSDTPQSVGEYLGLTKGNMSQRLLWLERHGYLKRSRDESDGRVVHLRLTDRARDALASLSPPRLWREAAGDTVRLGEELDGLLGRLLARGGYRAFGQCRTCRHHERVNGSPYCALIQVSLDPEQVDRLCREHEEPLPAA
ncbi:MAG: MarR family winged helix-turn-helix transcriptional regulator [Bryobacteraceae bacterium]|nr:MarR family winged helix-turn-helix transcriptional regulator [Bryobacteraceae bacterium]